MCDYVRRKILITKVLPNNF